MCGVSAPGPSPPQDTVTKLKFRLLVIVMPALATAEISVIIAASAQYEVLNTISPDVEPSEDQTRFISNFWSLGATGEDVYQFYPILC